MIVDWRMEECRNLGIQGLNHSWGAAVSAFRASGYVKTTGGQVAAPGMNADFHHLFLRSPLRCIFGFLCRSLLGVSFERGFVSPASGIYALLRRARGRIDSFSCFRLFVVSWWSFHSFEFGDWRLEEWTENTWVDRYLSYRKGLKKFLYQPLEKGKRRHYNRLIGGCVHRPKRRRCRSVVSYWYKREFVQKGVAKKGLKK